MTAHPTSIVTPRIARGGKAIYGAPLGILMLEAKFPRIPGDMGNGTTWPFPGAVSRGERARARKRWC